MRDRILRVQDLQTDVLRQIFAAGTRHVTPLLVAALFTVGVGNWIIYIRAPNLVLPMGCAVSILLLASTYFAGRGLAGLDRHSILWRTGYIHVATGLSALSLVLASIVANDYLPREELLVGGIALIVLNATMAILIGFAFSAFTGVGILQLVIAGVPGLAKVLYESIPETIAIAVMFIAIVMLMVRMIADSNADRTALVNAKAELEKAKHLAESADRAKSEFLASMSHEIRTPMNGVLGMAELLATTRLDARQKTFTDVIVKSGNALLTIINDILDFSRIEAGQLELRPTPFNLAEAIEDVAALLAMKATEKDLELIIRVDPRLPATVEGDVGRFRQIITNLASNALKFTDTGHVLIDVSGHAQHGMAHVSVRVQDTGIGIPEDKITAIFEKFAQVDQSSTRRHEGTGLGLAITSRLVRAMGGEVRAQSTLGVGSTFSFEIVLPVDETAEQERPLPTDVPGSRVLVVDDNAVNRRILLEQLRSWGFECAAVDSGPLGLAFLARASELGARVDCIVLDFQMPEMTGLEVAGAIRAQPSTVDIPVVLLTSVDQADCAHAETDQIIQAALTKPARSGLLRDTIVRVLHKAKTDAAPRRSAVFVPDEGEARRFACA